ncbi:MAG TPA: hypothetical protein VLA49_13585 [Anaerolineales bacterium]|nr:hypothetical protein [Anaerolineales bacterium]
MMSKQRESSLLILLLCGMFAISSCGGVEPARQTPAKTNASQEEKIVTLSPVKPDTAGETTMPSESIEVPAGEPPTVDGTIATEEWQNAEVEIFSDGSELLLLQAGGFLYLGIRANFKGMIAGNVFINQGDEISILHSSAALGTAIYQRGEESWQQKQDFAWRCRDSSNSESALAERAEFLEAEGWLAANGRMGTPNELEYKIKIPEQDFRLAVVYIKSSYPYEKVPWPVDLDDDCISPTPGGMPKILAFSPEAWKGLQLIR